MFISKSVNQNSPLMVFTQYQVRTDGHAEKYFYNIHVFIFPLVTDHSMQPLEVVTGFRISHVWDRTK